MKTSTLPVAALETCDRVRVRVQKPKDGSDVVLEYTEAYECSLIAEPLDVFREKGTERYIIADGENRLLALRKAGIKEIECRLHEGDELAALDFAIGCNQAHGLRRSKADKYHAFVRIMETDLRMKYRTDTDLSEKIGVSRRTVAAYKADWRESESGDKTTRRKKEKAKKEAKSNTRSGLDSKGDDADCIVVPPLKNKEKPETPRTLTPEQKKVAKQVRDSIPPAWTAADQHAYKLLIGAWSKSTAAARAKFLAEIDAQAAA